MQVWVTLQFGHNDQKPAKGISITQYEANLERMVTELRGLKANVVSSLGFFDDRWIVYKREIAKDCRLKFWKG